LCAALRYGETLVGKLRVRATDRLADNARVVRPFPVCRTRTDPEGRMDIAMAMSLTLFAIFTGSTAYFFYQIGR
jgi:hypothetical protein